MKIEMSRAMPFSVRSARIAPPAFNWSHRSSLIGIEAAAAPAQLHDALRSAGGVRQRGRNDQGDGHVPNVGRGIVSSRRGTRLGLWLKGCLSITGIGKNGL